MNNIYIKKPGFIIFYIFLFLSFTTHLRADISGVTAALGTNTVNTASLYTVTFTTGSSGALSAAANDTIIITFPENTAVPAAISAGSLIAINGTDITTAAAGSGQALTITTPVDILDDSPVTVIINSGALLINPSLPGTYTLDVHTSVEGTDVSSGNYSILSSATVLNVGTVVPNPSTLGNYADYTISVTLSSDGAIWGGNSGIIVNFPADTEVPTGALSVTGITVDGTTVDSAIGAGQQITLIPNQNINGSASFDIIFPASLQIRNPTSSGSTYTLDVSTSAQPAGTSSNYSITRSSTSLNVGSITPIPSTIGNYANYTIVFTTSPDGVLLGGTSQIQIVFPADTIVPNGALTNVTVNGTSAFSANGNTALRLVLIVPNQDIDGPTTVTVLIPDSALRNPTSVNSYDLTVETTPQPAGTSSNYNIGLSSTPVNVTGVTPNPLTLGNYASYTINFITNSDGALLGGTSEILLTFPADTDVPGAALSGITVNGTPVTSALGNHGLGEITIIPAQNLNGNTAITIFIPSDILQNPTSSGDYTLDVETSVQPSGTSPSYTIGQSSTAVEVTGVTPNPTTIGNSAAYTITFDTSSDGGLTGGISEIIVIFPNDTAVSDGALADVTINGAAPFSANGNSGTRTVTIISASDIGSSTGVTVFIPGSALTNPTGDANYSLSVSTTVQPAGISPLYAIGLSGNLINVTSVVPSPSVAGNDAAYTITIATSADGGLVGGTSEILVQFPVDTGVTGGSLSGITVNGTAASSADGNVPFQRFITIVPTQNFPGSSTLSLSIPDTALRNPTLAGNFTLNVATSVQPPGTSPAYSISQSATPIVVTGVTPNPDTPGSESDYTITFSTSSDGPLVGGASHIIVTFPDDTAVSNGALAGVTINGAAPFSANGNSVTRTVTIIPASDIGSSTGVTVFIPTNALQNPAQTGNYTLTVETSPQPAGTSPPYLIQISSTPVTVNSVSPTTPIVNTLAGYTVNLTLGVVMRSQKSSFFMIFPYNTEIPNGDISNVMVNGVPASSANGNSGTRTITIMPNADVVLTPFSIVIPETTLLNPSIPSTPYSLGVSTTAQPIGTQTYTFQASTTRISNVSVVPSPSRAGQVASYTVHFTTGAHGRLGAGNIITVEFPAGTSLPASFSSGNILVNSIGNTGTVYPVNRVVNILVPPGVMVANHGEVTVVLPGISNPGVGFYRLDDVHTDAEPFPVPSLYYWITADSQITMGQVLVSPDVINANAQYTVNLTLGAEGSLTQNIDKIFLSFPASTSLPLIPNPSNITVNGAVAANAVMLSLHSIEILSPIDISASASNKSVQVVFQTSFGITNPPLPGAYTLSGYTTIENTAVTSESYQINPSANTYLTPPQVQLSPLFTNSYGRYDIQCQTGSLGGLVKDISTISLVFPDNFIIPANIAANQISINNQPLTTCHWSRTLTPCLVM